MKIINWEMALHPINYLVILLMLIIAGIAGHEILQLVNISPAKSN
jgi:hypothetical protein